MGTAGTKEDEGLISEWLFKMIGLVWGEMPVLKVHERFPIRGFLCRIWKS